MTVLTHALSQNGQLATEVASHRNSVSNEHDMRDPTIRHTETVFVAGTLIDEQDCLAVEHSAGGLKQADNYCQSHT